MTTSPNRPEAMLIAGILLLFIGVGTMIIVKKESNQDRQYWIVNGKIMMNLDFVFSNATSENECTSTEEARAIINMKSPDAIKYVENDEFKEAIESLSLQESKEFATMLASERRDVLVCVVAGKVPNQEKFKASVHSAMEQYKKLPIEAKIDLLEMLAITLIEDITPLSEFFKEVFPKTARIDAA